MLAAMGSVIPVTQPYLKVPVTNRLPKWKGFNLLDFFSPDPAKSRKSTTEEQLKWMSD